MRSNFFNSGTDNAYIPPVECATKITLFLVKSSKDSKPNPGPPGRKNQL